ncbi:DNA polymerase III subunit epsilon [Hydrogenophaga crassostreae]|uniref:DNA polymerase III subunit epsilon n=1 Tax=Hydrogenophaga crassostreae TaxID=1763535 RepID=A0ABX2U593_9BURK|nr:DNA polymerase III subunit epsilon [Hydrogenophaga crassostreae]
MAEQVPVARSDEPDRNNADGEVLARRLEQNPDFRVLRRLRPVSDYGPPPEGASRFAQVLVLDTETTGLSHAADKIIELAMLLVNVDLATGLPFGPVELFEGFEDPGMPIPAVAKDITGITDQMVAGQRLDDGLVEAMAARADTVIAHNAGFDRPFVEARFPAFASKAWACSFKDIDWKAAGSGSSKLSALAADQGWFYDAHRAQVDCHALLQVLSRPLGSMGATGLSLLNDAAALPSFRLAVTGSPFESKDALKARGYRWDAEAKVWGCALPDESALEEELAWLAKAVYGGRNASVEVELQDSRVRYSARRGEVSKRRL